MNPKNDTKGCLKQIQIDKLSLHSVPLHTGYESRTSVANRESIENALCLLKHH
jgi:hypothetical protein